MKLSHKWMVVLLCAIALNFFIALKTAHVFAQVETDQACPSTLLLAVLGQDVEGAAVLLEYGANPNTSLENCRKLGFKEFYKLDWFPKGSSLLHVAAHVSNPRYIYDFTDEQIYVLLESEGANPEAKDERGHTPLDIFRNKQRDYRYSRSL